MKIKYLILVNIAAGIFFDTVLAQDVRVNWSTFDMGYAQPTSNNTAVKSLVGQSFAGTSTQPATTIESGFLANPIFSVITDVKEVNPGMPQVFALRQNYPNPFNPSTTILFDLPKASFVSLTVYNLLGEEKAVLLSEKSEAGSHKIRFDASGLPSGVYFYRILAGDYVSTRKLLLMK